MLPAIVACGVSFAGMQFLVSNYVGPELTDIVSSLTCIVVMVLVMKFWKPKNDHAARGRQARCPPVMKRHSAGEMFMAWLPYLLLVVFVLRVGRRRHQARDRPLDARPAAAVAADERRAR